jgi:predicted ABC-type ATPase
MKHLTLLAGPNGAGKTTFARDLLAGSEVVFVNADLIAAGLDPFQPERVALMAGRLMLARLRSLINEGRDVALETTLSGRHYAKLIPQWQQQGYHVVLYFLKMPSAEVCIERVRQRVAQGGHTIPEATIRRRFDSGWRNFQDIYQPLVDRWFVFNNLTTIPTLLEEGSR